MFRKKDADPIRPAGAGDRPADGTLQSPIELRSPGPTDTPAPRPPLAPPMRDIAGLRGQAMPAETAA